MPVGARRFSAWTTYLVPRMRRDALAQHATLQCYGVAERDMPVTTKSLDPLYFPLVLDALDQGVFTVDGNLCISSFNHGAERITGYAADDVIGSRCAEVFRTNLCEEVCPLRLSITSRRPTRNHQIHIRTRDGREVPISVSTSPLVTRAGRLLGGVEVFRDLTPLQDLRRRIDGQYRLADVIGKSPAMRRIFDLLPLVASSDATALVTGASGTGKELIARTIHGLSPRRMSPFVALNCAAIPETLLESELFGYKRGAFTDARRDKPGRIAAAERGTLFLDEIGDLPRLTQVKLLRFLQDRVYEPLGSNVPVRADVRVIAATNRDLLALVTAGSFREDLYFRLNVVQVEVPPLRDRSEDIPLLVNHYVRKFCESTGRTIEGVTDEAMARLVTYPFPGNVRELENAVERAFILCQGERIAVEHLPGPIGDSRHVSVVIPSGTVAEAERAAITAALERHGGNRTRAATELGIHRSTLIRKLRQMQRR
jgi:sigma-54 dependent transcriptional regulator, acetoin dehydrogenase operon transcriptional activator AcoR